MTIFNYAEISQGLGLPKESQTSTFNPTKAKSLVGISTPFYSAHRRQLINAGFFMRTICTRLFFVSAFMRSRPNYGGLVEGASARRFRVCGSTNLDQSTTNRLVPLGGGYKNHYSEAATMATTPTQKPFNVYTFAIGNPKRTLASFRRIRTISTAAQTERQARANLNGLRLTFIKCLPVNAQEVAA